MQLSVRRTALRFSIPISLHDARVMECLHVHGVQMCAVRRSEDGRLPTFEDFLGQPLGVFLVEFFWQHSLGGAIVNCDYHTVCVNATARLVLCNTIGVVPFTDTHIKESAASHLAVKRRFMVRNILAAYCVVRL